MTHDELEAFIRRAGFTHGWENLESAARRMAEQAVKELSTLRAAPGREPAKCPYEHAQPGQWSGVPTECAACNNDVGRCPLTAPQMLSAAPAEEAQPARSPEQQLRNAFEAMGYPEAQSWSSGDCMMAYCAGRGLDEEAQPAEPVAPWRDHQAAIDAKALATAQEIALMWGADRSQFISRIQVAVTDAMRWVQAGMAAPPAVQVRAQALEKHLRAAASALRSYQYGNDSHELAKAIADEIDRALKEQL